MKLSRATYKALSLETVVAFDVETTGLDSGKDEIIEAGMGWMEKGDVTRRYSQLFKPTVPIPVAVTQLTGIHEADCRDQPSLMGKLPEILKWLNSHWIVAHHAVFDLEFLQNARIGLQCNVHSG